MSSFIQLSSPSVLVTPWKMQFFKIVLLFGLASLVKASYDQGANGGGYEQQQQQQSVEAAVNSQRTISTYPVQSNQQTAPSPIVDINSGALPLTIRFNSLSSEINAIQKHFGNAGQVQRSSTVDEPDLLFQNIKKPIIQQIREVITPYRQLTQEVRPVQEKIETIIAKGQGQEQDNSNKYAGGGGGEQRGDDQSESSTGFTPAGQDALYRS